MPLVTRNSENARVWVGTSAPANPSNGDLFSNTAEDTLTVYDGSTFQTIGANSFSNAAVITHSETIGDYSTPNSATASSIDSDNSSAVSVTSEVNSTNKDLGDSASYKDFMGEQLESGSALIGVIPSTIGFYLTDVNASGGTVVAAIFNSSDAEVARGTPINTSSLTNNPTYTKYTFTFTTSHTLVEGDRIGLLCEGGFTGYIRMRGSGSDSYDSTNTVQVQRDGGVGQEWTTSTSLDIDFDIDGTSINTIYDDDTGTKLQTTQETNPSMVIDTGSTQNLLGIAIYRHSNTTETEIKIQSSSDDITYSDLRTITVSNITAGQWQYIRFNLVNARYLRIYGNSGSSAVLSINEIKYLTKTTEQVLSDLGILQISTSDTSLGLDGV